VVQFHYTLQFSSQASVAPTYKQWQDLIMDPNLDRRFGSEFVMEPLGCVITGTFYGTQDEFTASGIPSRLPSGGTMGLTIKNYLAALTQDAENEALYLSNIANPFYSKSLAMRRQDALSADKIKDLFTWVDNADKGSLVWFIIFDASGGAIADVPVNATSYAHRDKVLFYQSYIIGIPGVSDTSRKFLTDFHTKLLAALPSDAYGTYAGYVDPALGTDGPRQYWGDHLPALQQIKSTWDPKDIFHNPQSVPLPSKKNKF
jgi:hypothetical protein